MLMLIVLLQRCIRAVRRMAVIGNRQRCPAARIPAGIAVAKQMKHVPDAIWRVTVALSVSTKTGNNIIRFVEHYDILSN